MRAELGDGSQAETPHNYFSGQPASVVGNVLNPSGDLYYIHNDHLGTPQGLTDEAGVTIWSASYSPFGLATVNEDPDLNGIPVTFNPRFPGQYFDSETGFHYNYFRVYDPGTGRYLTSDPVGLDGGLNTYGYGNANPIRYTDPKGLATEIALGTCAIGGPANPACVGAIVWNGCKWAALLIVGGILATLDDDTCESGNSCDGGVDDFDESISPSDEDREDSNIDFEACEKRYQQDTATCNAITRKRGGQAGARCHASATQRYAACRAGRPIPPLDTWNN